MRWMTPFVYGARYSLRCYTYQQRDDTLYNIIW